MAETYGWQHKPSSLFAWLCAPGQLCHYHRPLCVCVCYFYVCVWGVTGGQTKLLSAKKIWTHTLSLPLLLFKSSNVLCRFLFRLSTLNEIILKLFSLNSKASCSRSKTWIPCGGHKAFVNLQGIRVQNWLWMFKLFFFLACESKSYMRRSNMKLEDEVSCFALNAQ